MLLLKLLGYIFQAQKGRRTYTNLTKKIVSLLGASEWRKLPHSQLVLTARQLSLLEPILCFSFPFVDKILKHVLKEDVGRQELFNLINLCSEPSLSVNRKVFVMLKLQKKIKSVIIIEDSES